LVEAHTATGFGIYTGRRQSKWAILRESGFETRFSTENNAADAHFDNLYILRDAQAE
jgi:hypothetical protein